MFAEIKAYGRLNVRYDKYKKQYEGFIYMVLIGIINKMI